jgi:hypothetical protein
VEDKLNYFFLAGAFFLAAAFFLAGAFFFAVAFFLAGAFFFAVAKTLTPFPKIKVNNYHTKDSNFSQT